MESMRERAVMRLTAIHCTEKIEQQREMKCDKEGENEVERELQGERGREDE